MSSVTSHNQLRPLRCVAQSYAWGQVGKASRVACMMQSANAASFELDNNKPYAELWLGTHPNGMSTVSVVDDEKKENGGTSLANGTTAPRQVSLLDYVRSNPALHCGTDSDDKADLTFLLKILSVRKVLSIQAHPDKVLAEKLHAAQPTVYKDPNHKPEMALAITPVRAMMGFRPLPEIVQHLQATPELVETVGPEFVAQLEQLVTSDNDERHRSLLQQLFETYLQVPADKVKELVEQMVERLQSEKLSSSLSVPLEIVDLILQLQQQFPGDCGVFAPLFLNMLTLQPGQALYIDANEPHAYISGDMVECMACSDNVVRAGLTPKLKDVPTLVDMLTYDCRRPTLTEGFQVDASTRRYQPPVSDFCMETITVPADETYELPAVASPSIILCLECDGDCVLRQGCSDLSETEETIQFGSAVFLSAGTTCTVSPGPMSGVKLTRAFTNVFYEEELKN